MNSDSEDITGHYSLSLVHLPQRCPLLSPARDLFLWPDISLLFLEIHVRLKTKLGQALQNIHPPNQVKGDHPCVRVKKSQKSSLSSISKP